MALIPIDARADALLVRRCRPRTGRCRCSRLRRYHRWAPAGWRNRLRATAGWLRANRPSPAERRFNLLVIVEHVGDVTARRGELGRQGQLHGHPALHVGGTASVEHRPVPGRRHGTSGAGSGRQRHGVQMPGQNDPLRPPQLRAGHDGVAIPCTTSKCGRVRKAFSTASARAVSFPETLLMSISAAVRSATSAVRSSGQGEGTGRAKSPNQLSQPRPAAPSTGAGGVRLRSVDLKP